MEELEKGLKELKDLQPKGWSNIVNCPSGPPRDWTTNQRVHMEEHMWQRMALLDISQRRVPGA